MGARRPSSTNPAFSGKRLSASLATLASPFLDQFPVPVRLAGLAHLAPPLLLCHLWEGRPPHMQLSFMVPIEVAPCAGLISPAPKAQPVDGVSAALDGAHAPPLVVEGQGVLCHLCHSWMMTCPYSV